MRDDLDYEEQTRGKKSKDSLVKSIIKNGFAPLILADSLKNSALSRDHKIKEVWKKSIKDYPDSAFENAVEGIDVVTSHAPEFSTENPSTAAALGLVLDIADPISYGATKMAAKKVPVTLAQGMMKAGDAMADAGTKAWVQKLVKKQDMKEVPRLVDYIKKKDLRGNLRDPEKLIKALEGEYDNAGAKVVEGSMDKVGQEIVGTVRKADRKGAEKINRGDIFRKMKRKVENLNADPNVSGVTKKEPYLGKLQDTIKPFEKRTTIIEGEAPKKPDVLPPLPTDDLETTIMNLTKEADAVKKAKAAQATQKAERAAAEKAVPKEPKVNDKELLDLLLKKKVAEETVDPLDKIPVPRQMKDMPDYPAKEVLDIKLHNKKADTVNRRYMQSQELKSELPSIEERIAALSDEAEIPPIPHEVEVPPAIPDEAIGRDLESILAELSDAQASKKARADTNKNISKSNADDLKKFGLEAKAAAPQAKKELIDRMSTLEDMWSLKVDARKKLRQADWDKSIQNLPEHKAMVMEATQEIDNKIVEALKDINFKEGNAADIYRALNDEYGTQADFLELVVDDALQKWRGGKSKGGALPALSGGVAAAIAAKTSGGNIPLSTIAGATTGEAVRRGVFSSIPEVKASIGDRLSKPEAAHLATQGSIETLEIPADYERAETDRELETKPKEQEEVSVDEADMSPEIQALIKGDRKPQSVEETAVPVEQPAQADPIDQKMSHVLIPEKPQWDPYVNEEVLNTFLPRDSKRILANPTALMAKMQQVAPNQVPVLQEMLDNDPESLAEAAPKLAMMFPALFEKDKYGMFDGKIVVPMMQQKFLMDLSEDEGMDAIEKANIAMKIQRGESIHS
jgi:hypothetical protein